MYSSSQNFVKPESNSYRSSTTKLQKEVEKEKRDRDHTKITCFCFSSLFSLLSLTLMFSILSSVVILIFSQTFLLQRVLSCINSVRNYSEFK